jgi:Flp pilus assembly protein TadD
MLNRFFNEARAVNAIRHENIVEVTDLFTDEEGRAHMVMEYLEGCTLGDLIKSRAPLPPSRVAHIGTQIADALSAAHEQGIIHRDVKPANVFLIKRKSTDDYVKLLDFGIARLHPDCGGIEATESGQIVGTPVYMPPEQAKGNPVSAYADIYSLGIILYEMLTGEFPFPKSSAIQMMMAHISDPPKPLDVPGLPIAFKELVEKCLSKNPTDRPLDAKTIAAELEQWAEQTKRSTAVHRIERHGTVKTPPAPANGFDETWDSSKKDAAAVDNAQTTRDPASRRPLLLGAAIGVLGLGALLFFVIQGASSSPPPRAETATSAGARPNDPGLRAAVDTEYGALGLPQTPITCQSQDEEILEVHLRIARLQAGGKPGAARPQDQQALQALGELGSDMSPETTFWKARCHLLAGEIDAAIQDAELAHQYCKDFAAAYAVEGTALAYKGDHLNAIKALEQAVLLQSSYTDARFNLALSQLATDQVAAAVASLSVVLSQDPKMPGARYLRGQSFLQLGDMTRALDDLNRAVTESPTNAGAWYALGFARQKTGDPSGAREAGCKAKSLGHARATCESSDAPSDPGEWVLDSFD